MQGWQNGTLAVELELPWSIQPGMRVTRSIVNIPSQAEISSWASRPSVIFHTIAMTSGTPGLGKNHVHKNVDNT